MRPNRLVLKQFGPFKDETIEFDQLQNHKLFLISGKTGAGKTTIFDGMMYALFGVASTKDRDYYHLRNINANDNEPTEVVYSFFMHNKQYEIHRNVPYTKQGNKSPIQKSLLVYEIIDSKKVLLASRIKEGNQIIYDIVKLDEHQFRKIFILPQGEFKSLLVANSSEKTAILRTLFDTTKLQKLSNRLKETLKKDQKKMTQLETTLNVQFGLFQTLFNDETELLIEEKIALIKDGITQLNNTITDNEKDLVKSRESLKSIENAYHEGEQLAHHIQQYNTLDEQLQSLQRHQEMIDTYQHDLKYLSQLKHYYETAHDLKVALQKRQDIESNLKQNKENEVLAEQSITALKDELSTLKGHDEKHVAMKNYVIKNERYLNKSYKQLDDQIEQISAQIEKLQKEMQSQQTLTQNLDQLEQKLMQSNNDRIALQNNIGIKEAEKLNLLQRLHAIDQLMQQIERIQSTHIQITDKTQVINEIKIKLQHLRRSENIQDIDQVNALKASVQIGEKCPVCSNIITTLDDKSLVEAHELQHTLFEQTQALLRIQTSLSIYLEDLILVPRSINMHNEDTLADLTPELEEVNHLINQVKQHDIQLSQFEQINKHLNMIHEKVDVQVQSTEHQLHDWTNELTSLQSQAHQLGEAISNRKVLAEQLSLKREQYTALIKQLEKYTDMKQMFEQDTETKSYQTFKKKFEQFQLNYLAYEKDVAALQQLLIDNQQSISLMHQQTTHLTLQLKENDENIQHFNNRIKQFEIPIMIQEKYETENIAETIAHYEKSIHDYQTRMISINKERERLEALIQGRDHPDLTALSIQVQEQAEAVNALHAKVSSMKEQHGSYIKYYKQINTTFAEYHQMMDKLRALIKLSNTLNGENAQKIDIETYVLMYYLEQTLKLANIRLREMTSNRYDLRRKSEKSGGGKQGLVIEVFDYNANQSRSISSLSGGETFLASLCLALGLSDFVMQVSGGIHLESVFIDEGFGTLDNETLDVAMNALMDLQYSGKLVGMISHVQLLKERIPAILKIETDGYDSHAKFEIK
ncbi:SMC family ATPase [Macrococcus capreoli]